MELIHHQIAENTGAIAQATVVLPQPLHLGLDQQVVELLVVGEQDVGRSLLQCALIGDHVGGSHRRRLFRIAGADVETSTQAGKGGNGVDQIGEAPGLVCGQGIHRIDQDRLDAARALGVLLAAVLQQGQQEALGFARTRACRHQGVTGCARQQPIKGLLLVPVRREGQRDLREPVAPGALMEGQGHRHVGPLEQLLAIRQEAVDQPLEPRGGGVEGGADGIGGHLLQLAGNNGGEQGLPQISWFRLGEIPVLTEDFIHAFHAYQEPARHRVPLLP